MVHPTPPKDLPIPFPPLSVMHARVTYRLLAATTLPPSKGALLRGGFGYAFQRIACPPSCWGRAEACPTTLLCPYRWVFETPHPAGIPHLHDLQDIPRPFVIEPSLDHQRQYAAGASLEFGLTLIGRGIDYVPYFLLGFAQLGATGLGRDLAPARLERVEVLEPFQPVGTPNARFQRRRWPPPPTGTSDGAPPRQTIAPRSEAAPTASAARHCWAATSKDKQITHQY